MKCYFKDWLEVIDENELLNTIKLLDNKYLVKNVFPNKDKVFNAFTKLSYRDLNVIMIGQDPYPQKDVATGLLFGNNPETTEDNLSPSLKIVKEASINFGVPHNLITFDNTLEDWASQGVLLLNTALTVEENNVGSHTMLWRPFITKLIHNISKDNSCLVFMLFGSQAKTLKPYIINKHYILEERHPAYYSRINSSMPSDIFKEANKILKKEYNKTIHWYREI